ncbi:hypothetical protein [Aggregatibacter actinomycetemcomitans]|uniref:hypothetical protein n=1 Tax=Aggregatibacter actinomycetemcomitans TaxID=714 RepID=UPI0006A6DCED|nr:hypothetical protein [Aggregatibacter actinomycetemcomitans]KYK76594.1 hypothetical protein SA2876_06815 [Aggregatibacter actinomycetemcomitans serotype e str. SA2876]
MINIKSELMLLEQQRKKEYISIIELLDFLKKHNSQSSFSEIATYLLAKLSPNDIRKTTEDLWGSEDYEIWERENGINIFSVPKSIDEKPSYLHPTSFFQALETIRDNPDGIYFPDDWDFIDEARIYLKKEQQDIHADRTRIEELLNIDTLAEGKQCEEIQTTQTTDNESVIIKQLQARISELENKAQQSVVNYDDFSIYGHTSENLKIIFEIAKKIAEKCDPDNLHSYPTKDQIAEYVKRYFVDSNKLCESVYQILIPEKVKTRGKPPEGADTFQGFI